MNRFFILFGAFLIIAFLCLFFMSVYHSSEVKAADKSYWNDSDVKAINGTLGEIRDELKIMNGLLRKIADRKE